MSDYVMKVAKAVFAWMAEPNKSFASEQAVINQIAKIIASVEAPWPVAWLSGVGEVTFDPLEAAKYGFPPLYKVPQPPAAEPVNKQLLDALKAGVSAVERGSFLLDIERLMQQTKEAIAAAEQQIKNERYDQRIIDALVDKKLGQRAQPEPIKKCPTCNGTGWIDVPYSYDYHRCPECNLLEKKAQPEPPVLTEDVLTAMRQLGKTYARTWKAGGSRGYVCGDVNVQLLGTVLDYMRAILAAAEAKRGEGMTVAGGADSCSQLCQLIKEGHKKNYPTGSA